MYYQVKEHEKISDVADGMDIPFSLIKYYNKFVKSEHEVHTGRKLLLPLRYTVLPDDTYDGIAGKFAVSKSEFGRLNPESNDTVIYPGQSILLPPQRFRIERSSNERNHNVQPSIPVHVVYVPVPVYPGMVNYWPHPNHEMPW